MMNQDKKIWGTAIKSARMTAGLTQRDLAKVLDCSQAYVNQMEKGYIGTQKFEEVINLLGFSFEIKLTKLAEVSI
jgi:transcriptional regulator with XRE-family HTH domain